MGSLYNDTKPDDIGYVEEVNNLVPLASERAVPTTWTCAWSPDGSLFAWAYGNRSVKIIPWSRIISRLPVLDADDFAPRNTIGSKEHSYIELSQNLRYQRRRGSAADGMSYSVTIHCGYTVNSVAFGAGEGIEKPDSIKEKSNVNQRALRQVDDWILATGLSNGRLRIWDVSTGGLLWELMDHKDIIGVLKFSPTGTLELASACRDGTIKLWDMTDDGNMFKTLRGKSASFWANSCAWSPDAKYIAGVGSHKVAVIWETETYTVHRKLEGHNHDVLDCDYSPDGAILATCSSDTRVILWDADTGDMIRVFSHLFPAPHPVLAGGENGAGVRSLSFSSDGLHICSACDDGLVRFWNVDDELLPERLALAEGTCCAYRPSGNVIAVGKVDGSVCFYAAPQKVNSMKNLCRLTIRKLLSGKKIDRLSIPIKHKEFLKYRSEL